MSQASQPYIIVNKDSFGSALSDQFDVFMNSITFKNGGNNSDDTTTAMSIDSASKDQDDGELTGRDRVQTYTLSKDLFNPLATRTKYTRPLLYQYYNKHPLLTNNNNNNNNKYKRKANNKRDKREKAKSILRSTRSGRGRATTTQARPSDQADTEPPPPTTTNTNTTGASTTEKGKATWSEVPSVRDDLGLLVAKCVSEETVSAYLLVISLLLSVWKDEFVSYQKYDFTSESAIPMLNLMAPLFMPPTGSGSGSGSGSDNNNKDTSHISDFQHIQDTYRNYSNQLKDYVISAPAPGTPPHQSSEKTSSSATAGIDTNRTVSFQETASPHVSHKVYNLRSSLTPSAAGALTETSVNANSGVMSFLPHGPYSDAGSTVESILTEQGTEEHRTVRYTLIIVAYINAYIDVFVYDCVVYGRIMALRQARRPAKKKRRKTNSSLRP